MKKKWTRLIAFFLSVMMVTTCLPLSVFAADSDAESAGTQTNLTPKTIADGSKMPAPAEPEIAYEYLMDTSADLSGMYVIYGPVDGSDTRMMYNNDTDAKTDHCKAAPADGKITIDSHGEGRHLWKVTKQGDGTYTIQGTMKDNDKYLTATASGNQLALGNTATKFTITHQGNGTYYVMSGGNYLFWDGTLGSAGWKMQSAASGIQFYKKTEVPFTIAQTEFKGTSSKPMDRLHILNQDDDVDTDYRIPALVTLDNGWIVAACDIRWTSTQDSPNNLDTIVSVSKDGGNTWEWEIVNYFSDFAPINGGDQRKYSASFIDPALLVDNNGTLWMAVDLQPTYVNLGKNAQKTGSGFDGDGYLMVGPISESEWETKVNTTLGRNEATRLQYQAHYEYRVDINSVNSDSVTATATKDGKEVTVYPIFHKDTKANTGYYVDAFFDLYYDYDEDGIKPVQVVQKESSALIQANLFYIQSPWKAYSTTYLMIRKATVEGDGLVWGDPQLISGVKNFDGETFLAFCPGRGTSIQVAGEHGEPVERIIFPVYDNVSSERASAVYTDDGGATWHRGARVENGESTSNSESQIVELHDGSGNRFLRIFSRNPDSGQYVGYADSFDNGLTWTATKYDRNMPNGHGTMMSFINLEGFLVSPEGDVYENLDLVLASYPRGSASNRRSNGIVRIGYYDTETEAMVWLNDKDDIRYPYRFTYSCLTQLRDGDHFTDRFALLYEDERTWASDHGMEMGFDTFTTADLLGGGWRLVPPHVHNADSSTVTKQATCTEAGVMAFNCSVCGKFSRNEPIPASHTEQDIEATAATCTTDGNTAGVECSVCHKILTKPVVIPATGHTVVIDPAVAATETTPGKTVGSHCGVCEAVLLAQKEIPALNPSPSPDPSPDPGPSSDPSPSPDPGPGSNPIPVTPVGPGGTGTTTKPSTPDTSPTTNPDGSTTTTVTDSKTGTVTETTKKPDGTVETVETKKDGTVTETTEKPDGTKTETTKNTDGSTEVVETKPDGTKTETTEKPDGTVETVETKKDGTVTETTKNTDGTVETVETKPDGTKTETTEKPDGSSEVVETKPDGTVTETTKNTDGSTEVVETKKDGTITATATDPKGGKVEKVTTPEKDVAITVTDAGGDVLAKVELPAEIPAVETRFEDVPEGHWADEAIHSMAALEVVGGVGDDHFDMNGDMTRGALATVLSRLSDGQKGLEANFADVASDKWYADGIAWAARTGVVTGYSATEFGPNDAITREQLAVMLCRYARLLGMDTTADSAALGSFKDGSSTHSWAADSIAWCVDKGILKGMGSSTLAPTATATRAQVSVMLQRFMALMK